MSHREFNSWSSCYELILVFSNIPSREERREEIDLSHIYLDQPSACCLVLVRRDVTRKLLVVASRCVINILSLSLSLSLSLLLHTLVNRQGTPEVLTLNTLL